MHPSEIDIEITPMELHLRRVSDLFDNLSTEMYYGINFRAVLIGANETFLSDLEGFVEECKAQRLALGTDF